MQIKNFKGIIIYEDNNVTMKATLETAVKADAELVCACFYNANLCNADLRGACLANVNLTGAKLRGVKL